MPRHRLALLPQAHLGDPLTEPRARKQRLQAVLLGYLQAASPCWPGTDGLTLEDALAGYRHAVAAGLVPGLEELLRHHPDLAEDLRALFGPQKLLPPEAPRRTIPVARLAVAWTIMLGGMVGYWCLRPLFVSVLAWTEGTGAVLFVSSKLATLVCMPPAERRRLSWGRFLAYLFWPGMQPRHFLPERSPADVRPAPTVAGMLLNAAAAAVLLWVLPGLMPGDWPRALRLASGLVGYAFLLLFALFDAWSLVYRACGIGVEKLWHNPAASTSLADFWGRRWNRIFSGMLREVLFFPLARRVGAAAALVSVFLYSGLMHENFSVAARSGYGLPLLYFVIQGAGMWLESRSAVRRAFQRRPWLGRLWTAAVVLGPCLLLCHEGFLREYAAPKLVSLGVPGL
jgi:alginate O-acetyltransferase complex protein AlgI